MATLRRSSILAGFACVILSSTSALAIDGQAFADRLQAVFNDQGTPLSFTGVETEGETVILKGVSVGTGDEATQVGDVRFENVTGSTEGGWRVERIPFEDIDIAEEETRTLAQGMVVEGLTIAPPSEAEGEEQLTALQFERAAIESVAVEQGGEEAFRMAGLDVTNAPSENGGFAAEFSLDEFFIDTTLDENSAGAKTMTELGYPQLRGDMSGSAVWETNTGELSLSPLRINVEDAGELNFSYTISGYTPEFVQSLTRLQQQMATNPEGEGSSMAMLGLISQLYLNSAELSFTDNSLTDKLLGFYAEQNGQTREELVATLVGTLPLALAYLNNPEFQTQVTEAVQNFLNDPQSLTISIAPDAPVPATQIVGAAMGAPQTLPAVLDLTVTSNGQQP